MRFVEVARRNKGFSQHQLARLARIDQTQVSMIERGVCLPTADQAERIAAALEIPAEILCNEVPISPVAERVER